MNYTVQFFGISMTPLTPLFPAVATTLSLSLLSPETGNINVALGGTIPGTGGPGGSALAHDERSRIVPPHPLLEAAPPTLPTFLPPPTPPPVDLHNCLSARRRKQEELSQLFTFRPSAICYLGRPTHVYHTHDTGLSGDAAKLLLFLAC